MKKFAAVLTALAFIFALVPAGAESAGSASGDWYADYDGLPMQLTLEPGGLYRFTAMNLDAYSDSGEWEERESLVLLDGDEEDPLTHEEDRLSNEPLELYFSREVWEACYTPAAPAALRPGDLDGEWFAVFADIGGVILPDEMLADDTEAVIRGTAVALGGEIFNDVQTDFVYEENALVLRDEEESFSVTLQLLRDGMMQMDITASGETLTIYLMQDL